MMADNNFWLHNISFILTVYLIESRLRFSGILRPNVCTVHKKPLQSFKIIFQSLKCIVYLCILLSVDQVNDVNFENMSNDDAVRILREIVSKTG